MLTSSDHITLLLPTIRLVDTWQWTCPGCVETPRSMEVQLGVDDGETRAEQAADVFG
jgi:hypothetical protein